MRVSVIGTGYVGLVAATCLAELGHDVVCVDADRSKVEGITRGVAPICEHGVRDLLHKHCGGRLVATTDVARAIAATELTLLTVDTPLGGSEIDSRNVIRATTQIALALRDKAAYHTVVIKSTVVPGTTENVLLPVLQSVSGKRGGPQFGLVMNPEFLTEGEAVANFLSPDRVVLGGIDERSMDTVDSLYRELRTAVRIRTNPRTAEMIKYASNCLLATMISFSNEIANAGSALGGIDVTEVMKGVHASRHLRITLPDGTRIEPGITSFLWAGCGFGGSCLPKDVQALIAHAGRAGEEMSLLRAVLRVNQQQSGRVIDLVKRHLASLTGVKIAVLGLSFKPDTADMRDSPAIPIIRELLRQGATVAAYDPAAGDEARNVFGTCVEICDQLDAAIAGAAAVVVVTRWKQFADLADHVRGMDPPPLVVDCRRMLNKDDFARYAGIGR